MRSPLEAFDNEIVSLAYHANLINTHSEPQIKKEDIVVIEMDNASIEYLGRINQWPRAFDAEVINYLVSGKPKSIVLDLLYTESDTLPAYYNEILSLRGINNGKEIIEKLSTDDMLEQAIRNAGNVIIPFFDDDIEEFKRLSKEERALLPRILIKKEFSHKLNKVTHPVLPVNSFAKAANSIGNISVFSENDGAVWNYTLIQTLPKVKGDSDDSVWVTANIGVLAAAQYLSIPYNNITYNGDFLNLGKTVSVPSNEKGEMTLNFPNLDEDFKRISYLKVLEKRMPSEFFENKVIFIGATASGISDLKTTPVSSKVPGVYLHVTAFYDIVNNWFITKESAQSLLLYLFIANLLLAVLFLRVKPLISLGSLVLILITSFFAFVLLIYPQMLVVFPVSLFLVDFPVVFLVTLLYRYITEEKEKNKLKKAFSSYVSAEVVEMISQSHDSVSLNGEKKELTVLFSDIRNFTKYSEKASPQNVIKFLNQYLTIMTDAIFKFRGTIDKFMGDGIMVVFGAPILQVNHAELACDTALEMLRLLDQVNQNLGPDHTSPIEVGIGINTGEMTVGNIGSSKKFDYTVIGDSVNLGSRIEGLNKVFSTNILVSDLTKNAVKAENFLFRELGKVLVKGKVNEVMIYELIDYKINEAKHSKFLFYYNSGLNEYRNKQFEKSLIFFESALEYRPNDKTVLIYINFCNNCRNNPDLYTELIYLSQ